MTTGALMICRKCGKSIPGDSERCDQCGAVVTGGQTATGEAQSSWVIGSDASQCNIFIDKPTVSRRHCVLRRRGDQFYLEDLNSSNKTFINGQQIYCETEVTRTDRITLGRNVDFGEYWPAQGARLRPRRTTTIATRKVLSIGRGPQNDIVLNRPRVSWKHAELISERGGWTLVDAGSTHGTAVGSPENKIRSQEVSPDDIAYFGDFTPQQGWPIRQLMNGQAAKLLEELRLSRARTIIGRGAECDIVLDHPSISKQHAEVIREGNRTYVKDLGSLNGTFVEGKPVSGMVLVPPSGVIALGIFTLAVTDSGTLEKTEYNGDFVLSVEGVGIQVSSRRLLEDVSFTLLPQEMIALMGGSGAGKTTLLKALCGYTRPAQGQILYNGRDLYSNYDEFRHLIGYVPQDDIMHSELKVQEALLFSVMLRTGQDEESAMKDVDSVLRKLQLSDIRDQIIGSPLKKVISGGQRKRVNIAMELLCRPSCLFLDEPTSGLSSQDAEMVVGVLKNLAGEGKTVVTTIHQPSRDIFEMFSALVVLKRDKALNGAPWIPGRRVYFGPAYPDSLDFFNPEKSRERRSSGSLPGPELLFEQLDGANAEPADVWEKRFLRSKFRSQYIDDRRDPPVKTNPMPAAPKRRPLWQAWLLVRRNFIIKMRDPMQRSFLFLQPVLFGALIVLLFHGLGNRNFSYEEFEKFKAKLITVHFLVAIAAVWFGCNSAVREIVGELPIYLRERMACLSTRNYILSKYLFLTCVCLFQCFMLLVIVYFGAGLQGGFWYYLGTVWLTAMVGVSVGLAISALAALSKAPEAAVAALPLVLLPVILLGGGIYPLHNIEGFEIGGVPVARHLAAIAPTRWLFEANLVREAESRNKAWTRGDNPWCAKIIDARKAVPATDQGPASQRLAVLADTCEEDPKNERDLAWDRFPEDKGFKRMGIVTCLSWLAGIFFAFLVATIYLLRKLEKKEVG